MGEAKGEEKKDGLLLEEAAKGRRSLAHSLARVNRFEEPDRRWEEVEEDGKRENAA